MTTDRTALLERQIKSQAARTELVARGLDADLLEPHIVDRLEVTESATVRSRDGKSVGDLIDAMRGHATLGRHFGGNGKNEKPSWEGKKFADMTRDEQVAFCDARYGDDAA